MTARLGPRRRVYVHERILESSASVRHDVLHKPYAAAAVAAAASELYASNTSLQ